MSSGILDETEQLTLLLAAENSRKRFTLKGEMLVGRDPACAIVIQSLHISRYHAKIIASANITTIEDLNSANGTYINGLRLVGKSQLQVGDLLCFDDHAFRILDSTAATAARSKPATPSPIPEVVTDSVPAAVEVTQPATHEAETSVDPNLITQKPVSSLAAGSPPPLPETGPVMDDGDESEDDTRTLTYHEMKEILRWSQNAQTNEVAEEPRFTVETAPLEGKVIPLLPLDMDTRWKIGRDLTSKICLRDKSIEIDHAYISRNPSGFRLTATSAGKSYLLNGQPLRDSYLHHGDVVQLGRITLRFATDLLQPIDKAEEPAEVLELAGIKWKMWATAGFLALVIAVVFILTPRH